MRRSYWKNTAPYDAILALIVSLVVLAVLAVLGHADGLVVMHPVLPQDSDAPTIQSATATAVGRVLSISLNEAVQFSAAPNADGISLSASGGAATVTYLGGTGATVLSFTVSRTLGPSETVTLSYNSAAGDIEDIAGNDLASASDVAVVVINDQTDQTPPTAASAIISGTSLAVTHSEAVDFTGGGSALGLALNASGGEVTASYASGAGTATLTYNLSRAVAGEETVTVSYDAAVGDIEDANGNDLATYSALAVTVYTAPVAVSASVTSGGYPWLTVTYSERVKFNGRYTTTTLGALTVTASGGPVTVQWLDSSAASRTTHVYYLSRVIAPDETVTLAYNDVPGVLEAVDDGVDVATFSGLAVPVTAPIYDDPLIVTSSTTLTEDITTNSYAAVYLCGKYKVLDGDGFTITNTGRYGVIVYDPNVHKEIPKVTSTSAEGCVIQNLEIILNGPDTVNDKAGVWVYRGHNNLNYNKIDNCRIEVFDGQDPCSVLITSRSLPIEDSLLIVHPNKAKQTNRHALPGNVDIVQPGTAGPQITRCTILGGNSGVIGANYVVDSVISTDSYVTNGYAAHGSGNYHNNLVIAESGRGFAFSHGVNGTFTDNVILHCELPNLEYGRKLTAPALRSRYDTHDCTYTGNTSLGVAGGPYCMAAGMFLSNDGGTGNNFSNNHATAIMLGEYNPSVYGEASPLALEGNNYSLEQVDQIDGNTFRGNQRLIRCEGNDGFSQQTRHLIGNHFERVTAADAVDDFFIAAQDKLDALTLNDMCRVAAQQRLDERKAYLEGLAVQYGDPSQFHFWRLKQYRGTAQADRPTTAYIVDSTYGAGVDPRTWDAATNVRAGLDVKVGYTVDEVVQWDFGFTKDAAIGAPISLVELP